MPEFLIAKRFGVRNIVRCPREFLTKTIEMLCRVEFLQFKPPTTHVHKFTLHSAKFVFSHNFYSHTTTRTQHNTKQTAQLQPQCK